MNQEGIFKKVGQILNELQDQYEFLARNPAQLNDLELELFLANANFLSDHVQIIKKFNSNIPLKEIPEHSEDQSDVVAITEIEPLVQIPVIQMNTFKSNHVPEQLETTEPEKELKMEKEKTLEELEAEYAEVSEPESVVHELESVEKEEEVIANDEVEQSKSEPLKFEFLMDNNVETDEFEFEEKSIESIFDRPLSKEEEEIIAEKQRVREDPTPIIEQTEEKVKEQSEEKTIVPPVEPVMPPVVSVVPPVEAVPVVSVYEKPVVQIEPNNITEVPQARPTLNDLLASKSTSANTLNDENNNKAKITDLKQAINLNEKLLYIKDLFNGYNLAYAEAIELINKMPDFKTADNFLRNNYAVKNNWTDKQSTVDKFYDLLNQRFDVK